MPEPALAALLLPFFSLAAAAQGASPPPYLDDRSDAAALVRSLYNAVNRKEYARAWSYFGDDKPAKDLQSFVNGYAATEKVDLATGSVAAEGAAGSMFYSLPVAIRATGTDGSRHVFAGCYTARLADPAIQGDMFVPLHLERGTLKPSSGDLLDALPADCGGERLPTPEDAGLAAAQARFAADYSAVCATLAPDADPDAAEPTSFALPYRPKDAGAADPEQMLRLYRFPCGMGADNSVEVYYLRDAEGTLGQLQFATPELDFRYVGGDPEGAVKSLTIVGYKAADQLVNSDYSQATRTIVSADKWRGLGDASSNGTWLFRDGTFPLVRYDVDASEDGKIDPQTVFDVDTPP